MHCTAPLIQKAASFQKEPRQGDSVPFLSQENEPPEAERLALGSLKRMAERGS